LISTAYVKKKHVTNDSTLCQRTTIRMDSLPHTAKLNMLCTVKPV